MTRPVPHHQSLLFGAVLLIAGSGAALAQDSAPNEEVTIEGPYTIHRDKLMIAEKPFREATKVAISQKVNYADLDLSKDWGRELLRIRVSEVAHDVCHEISRHYPTGVYILSPDETQCARDAVGNAIASVRENIAASAKQPGVSVAALP